MAITYVGEAGIAGGAQPTPQTISYHSTVGNTLILCGFLFYSSVGSVPGISSITDSAGNTWHYATGSSQNPPYTVDSYSSYNSVEFVAWCIDAAAITSLTYTMPNASPWTRVTLSEWSGIGSLDSSAGATAATGTNPAATLNLTDAGDLVVGALENNSGNQTLSMPPGWTEFSSAGYFPNVAFGFPGVTGSYSPPYSMSGSDDWGIALAAFKPASAGGSNPGAFMPFFQ